MRLATVGARVPVGQGSRHGVPIVALIRRQGPWRDGDHVQARTLPWMHWLDTG